jgi:hypothetical protein
MKAIILTLLLCFSCTRYASFSKDAVGLQIAPVAMEITHLNEVEWNIGARREETVSQSITFIVDLPRLRNADLEYLSKERGINAWLVRLIVSRGSETQDLGSLYSPFQPKKFSRGINPGSPSSVNLKIYYAAAYASERFRMLRCPVFSHNKNISKMGIRGVNEDFSLALGQAVPYLEKSQLVELSPSSFNAGNSLIGNYFIEIAAFDSNKKIILSSFKRIPMYVSVASEESVNVKSCQGVHPETK